MKIIKSFFDNKVLLLDAKAHKDYRGVFSELYSKKVFFKLGIKENFVQDNYSFSKNKFTFRGLHLQLKPYQQSKIVRVSSGAIIDFIVDLRKNSKTYRKSISIKLNNKKMHLLFISSGFAHGFLTLENSTAVNYKVSKEYSPKHSLSIFYKDPYIKLKLVKNINKYIISQKDKNGISLMEYEKILLKQKNKK